MQNCTKILFTGFNGFDQWLGKKLLEEGFSEIENSIVILPRYQANWRSKMVIKWCYNVFLDDRGLIVTGFYRNNTITPVETPTNIKFDIIGANDKHILLVNDYNNVWELKLASKDRLEWKQLTSFVSVDACNDDDANRKIEKVVKVVCGETMNLALTDVGSVFDIPSKIVNFNDCDGKVVDIVCGYEHAMLLTDKGNVYTWGGGSRCQLGHGDIEKRDHPELVNALAGIVITKVAAGGWHCCAISECGDLYSWGWNDKGQLGILEKEKPKTNLKFKKSKNDSSNESTSTCEGRDEDQCANYTLPMLVEFYLTPDEQVDRFVVDVDCGSKHTVVKMDDGSIWVTGWNEYSQLGLSHECKSLKFFKQILLNMRNSNIMCGPWSTVLFDIT